MNPTRKTIEARRAKFLEWLTAHGAQVLSTTNEWELARFECSSGVAIIYANRKGETTFTGGARQAWDAYRTGTQWNAYGATKRKKLTPLFRTLMERDGDLCFFCCQPMADDAMSIEHLVPVAHGGPNHISNLVLAHPVPCNQRAGHLSAMEKIRIRERAMENV